MDESSPTQNRRSRRANVLMSASLEVSGATLAVKLRNLSAEGALVEADQLPVEGSVVLFRKGDLSTPGHVAWTRGNQAGIAFDALLDPVQLMRHVPAPRARVAPAFRRPGVRATELSPQERTFAERFVFGRPLPSPGD
jgi:hypothetical protein